MPENPPPPVPIIGNPFLGQLPQFPQTKLYYGDPVPVPPGDQIGDVQNLLDLLRDPALGALVSSTTGMGGFDWTQAMGDAGYGGMGGGGYSSGGSTGGTMNVATTTMRDMMLNSTDAMSRDLANQMWTLNQDPLTMKNQLIQRWTDNQNAPSPEIQQNYFNAIDDLFEEKSRYDYTQLQNQQVSQGMNPLQEMMAQWGIPTPDQHYGAQTQTNPVTGETVVTGYLWPQDLAGNFNRYLPSMRPEMRGIRRDIRQARRESDRRGEGTIAWGGANMYEPARQAATPDSPVLDEANRFLKVDPFAQYFQRDPDYEPSERVQFTPGEDRFADYFNIESPQVWDQGPAAVLSAQPVQPEPAPNLGSGVMWANRATVPQYSVQQPSELYQEVNPMYQQLHQVQREEARAQRFYNQMATDYLNQQNRTPQADAWNARLNYLRSVGINV